MADVEVLVVGAGPVGLTAAGELRRRGVECRVIDRLPARQPYAKAVGIQPRTLEIWDRMGVVREILAAAAPMRGQLVYVNGTEQARVELTLPPEVPYGFAVLPQNDTERILEDVLVRGGGRIERGTELVGFEEHADGVRAELALPSGAREQVEARYLLGCDGAHSIVRKILGFGFEGSAMPEEYILGDVEVDWDLPAGYAIRSMHRSDGRTDDLLVCIPLPGRNRYRMSMLVPPELSRARPDGEEGVSHGLEGGPAPGLEHLQAVLDRLAPEPTTASRLRWSSVFRISHRLVDRYGTDRVFLAGDAAHIHPPTGAQGMNTGIQDACNLAWKVAMAVRSTASAQLLPSYEAERRPVGEEVVQRTVRHAAAGVQADPEDPSTLIQREAQLLVGYRGSPIVGPDPASPPGPAPGDRAPDCGGLRFGLTAFPSRLFDLLRGQEHTLLLYVDQEAQLAACEEAVAAAHSAAHGRLDVWVIVAPGTSADGLPLPVVEDARGEFRENYGAAGGAGFVIRPDGYVGLRAARINGPELVSGLAAVFRP
ncbi:FAD-dependent monooxygenase [Streptomyces kronopolitis]|uniref:FAD-dependent monooxygenase n=1 Tax=Streptomyces kronopolitis TaxID=1612435 RepID=UPI0020C0B051|nr:FAD-dependent monooxygenase [Streptomyces kronopolitis]MCL6299981.1 FAD-dependent monooxygenase [Streptomyces kronopolitis]